MLIHKGKTIDLRDADSVELCMSWNSFEDFDLLAVYEAQDGSQGIIYFTEPGSLEEEPYIRLHDDIDFSVIEGENTEKITVRKMAMKWILILGWSFERVEESNSLNFVDSGMKLSLRNEDQTVETMSSELGIGNVCLFGRLQKDQRGILQFHNILQCFMMPPLGDIEELYSHLPTKQ